MTLWETFAMLPVTEDTANDCRLRPPPGESGKRSQAKQVALLPGGHAVTRKHVWKTCKSCGSPGDSKTDELSPYEGGRGVKASLRGFVLWLRVNLGERTCVCVVHAWCDYGVIHKEWTERCCQTCTSSEAQREKHELLWRLWFDPTPSCLPIIYQFLQTRSDRGTAAAPERIFVITRVEIEADDR